MQDEADTAARRDRILGELSELCLDVARDLREAALAAEDPAVKADLARALHQVCRSIRQSLALEARFEREAKRQDHEDRARATEVAGMAVEVRKSRVSAGVERLIWAEAEGEEAERLVGELNDRLEDEALCDQFLAETVQAHIARVARLLGLETVPFTMADDPPDPAPPTPDGGSHQPSG